MGERPLHLSVLDQSPIAQSGTAVSAVRETIELARLADQLGYRRFWVAEHHASETFAGAAPEVLIAAIAMATARIRVGSGGVLLPHYSPYKVAETFGVIAAIAPGRIDLGIGRASGCDPIATQALRRHRHIASVSSDFPGQLAELIAYHRPEDDAAGGTALSRLRATLPHGGSPADILLLGSSPESARLAARLGLPYVIADFINPQASGLADLYRANFQPSRTLGTPKVIVATAAICAEDHDRASDLRYPFIMVMALMFEGHIIPVPSVADAKRWASANPDMAQPIMHVTWGTPDAVATGLRRIADRYGSDEIMICNIVPEFDARLDSYRLIAAALKPEERRSLTEEGAVA
ncbi:LLM class flavin-dependent oxidoreductase [Sphingomonas fuzhouensis]|uniref:LLM class flavin-dependent oxidoreductase n=1 Tax=Sphingomonas fuzhouensis TaxID=3106033 RepID=UPI002AFFC461|nr:LLM class flavin-dependent oxidoreductase [Sphingomonas sp. SGZ-02]